MIFFWNQDPVLLDLGFLQIRYYGVLFASGFFLGTLIMKQVFLAENKDPKDLDSLLFYMVLGTVIGARLGHCLFYEPDFYLSHPIEILMVQKGGLASHGAALGMFLTLWWFAQKKGYAYLWLLERIALTVPIGGALIRTGNFFNQEIIGRPTDGSWGGVFGLIDPLPRHPAQLYEAACYLLTFGVLFTLYHRAKTKDFNGRLLGLMLVGIFISRLFIE